MARKDRLLWLSMGLLAPAPALASDYTGFTTLIVGLPLLVLANAVLALLFLARPTRWLRIAASIVAMPTLLLAALIFFTDTMRALAKVLDRPALPPVLIVMVYVGLWGLLAWLQLRYWRRTGPPRPGA